MTENTNHPKSTGEHKLLRLVLLLQVVILLWLAKPYLDEAFNRGSHTDTPAVATVPATPPSLESKVPNASSFFSPGLASQLQSPSHRRLAHPADRMRAEMESMMSQANRAFADFDSVFGADAAWSSVPASPAMNMRERDDAYELTLALPDTDPESLEIHLDGRVLSIASRQATRTANAASSQSFSTRLLMPGPVDAAAPLQITNDNQRIRIRISKPAAATAALNP